MFRIFLVMLLAVSLSGCSALSEGTEKAEQEVDHIHKLFNDQEFDRIFTRAGQQYRDNTDKKIHDGLFKTVHRKLGQVTNKTLSGWRVNATTSGTFAVLTYETEFAKGEGLETFTINLVGEKAKMVGYNINSPALIIDLEE
ncbi:Protein of unknown function [Parasphingorhabdus marina DSM 22363]|uniref:DUF4019 domain-containing protein n=1 Tax=Parasphingorhabdus marina DSM 22363 TaxID=1123272 RepID=A0A1N6G736_9SPHN|nr:hypothetical protein [Parasphingorhabdus marina]SIO03323.1 Protein of unknown function [Parasphingorhabdus marina DSM 22363]